MKWKAELLVEVTTTPASARQMLFDVLNQESVAVAIYLYFANSLGIAWIFLTPKAIRPKLHFLDSAHQFYIYPRADRHL